jgi:metal-sulfur cluster biosynthetic enzyme
VGEIEKEYRSRFALSIDFLIDLSTFLTKEQMMSKPTSEQIFAVIKEKVRDPELMMNIVDLGLVYGVDVTDKNTAEVTMTLTSPGCPAGPEIITNVQREAHNAFPELEEVNVHLTWTPFWTPDMMSDDAKDELGIF